MAPATRLATTEKERQEQLDAVRTKARRAATWLATEKEAQAQLDAALVKASSASDRMQQLRHENSQISFAMMVVATSGRIELDLAILHYQRCLEELHEATNDLARFDTGDE